MWKHYLIGGAVSLGAGYLFYRMVDWGQMVQALAHMDPWYLLPCLVLYLMSYAARAVRWHYLMRPVARVPFMPLFSAVMIGFLGNNLLPAHLGEVVRAVVLGRSQGVSKSAVFATIVMERIWDGFTVLFLLMVVLIFMDLPSGRVAGSPITVEHLRLGGWWGLALFGGLMLAMQAFRWQRRRALNVCAFCLRPLPERISGKLLGTIDAFADGLATARAGDLAWVALWSLGVWLCLGLWAWSLFPAFGLKLGPMAGILMEVMVALALLIPTAPGFIGTFQAAATAMLLLMGAGAGVAGSYAMMLWLVHFVSTSLMGIWFLWREGLGFSVFTGRA